MPAVMLTLSLRSVASITAGYSKDTLRVNQKPKLPSCLPPMAHGSKIHVAWGAGYSRMGLEEGHSGGDEKKAARGGRLFYYQSDKLVAYFITLTALVVPSV